jgi:DNA polymerase elongation subunit (family B)
MDYLENARSILSNRRDARIASIDLETLMPPGTKFLSGERIIAISISWIDHDIRSKVYIAESDSEDSEYNILALLNEKLGEILPSIIIGYNQTGYDIPLIQMKMKRLSYSKRLRNIERVLGIAYCLDMMYVISDELGKYDGDYYIRKLDEVVTHEKYDHLPLSRAKNLVHIDGMSKPEAINYLWKNDRDKFVKYCIGDTRDLILILLDTLGLGSPEL